MSNNLKVLCVSSGGCTILSILSDKISSIDSIDINESQNFLCELKAVISKYFNDIDKILDFYQGNYTKTYYDELLNKICLSEKCKKYWLSNMDTIYYGINRSGKFEELFRYLVSVNMDYKKAFDRDYLTTIFGKDAVKNSKDREFYDHFSNVINTYKKMYVPEDNYFYYQILHDCYPKNNLPYYLNHLDNLDNTHKINYIVGNYITYIKTVPDNYYNIVQTSNLTDWMDNSQLVNFVNELHRIVRSGGYVIMRRLNGDYKLSELIKGFFISVDIPIDKSHFYSEVIAGQKL